MKKIILLILAVATLGFAAVTFLSNTDSTRGGDIVIDTSVPPINDPIDVASGFVSDWVDVQQATTVPSVADYIAESTVITTDVADTIRTRFETETDIEPITCQATMPARVGAKLIFADDLRAEVSVVARGADKSPRQAIVTLGRTETDWEITSHECIDLSSPEQPEFTFERTGRLAKDSVPAPYNNSNWHVLYLDGDRVGIVPLAFGETSQCTNGGDVTVCTPDQFTENTIVEVRGDLTEAGAVVQEMTLQ